MGPAMSAFLSFRQAENPIVRKDPNQVGFAVNPRRWVVERFFAWIGRNRRLAKDFDAPSTPHAPSSTPHPSCCSCVGSLLLLSKPTSGQLRFGQAIVGGSAGVNLRKQW